MVPWCLGHPAPETTFKYFLIHCKGHTLVCLGALADMYHYKVTEALRKCELTRTNLRQLWNATNAWEAQQAHYHLMTHRRVQEVGSWGEGVQAEGSHTGECAGQPKVYKSTNRFGAVMHACTWGYNGCYTDSRGLYCSPCSAGTRCEEGITAFHRRSTGRAVCTFTSLRRVPDHPHPRYSPDKILCFFKGPGRCISRR